MSFGQTLVATLTHGDSISMYYDTHAYQKAMANAVDGDMINLSGGGFIATNITKAVTIRGTGIDDVNPTYIINNFDISIPETTTSRLTIEGVRISNKITTKGTLNNAYFVKDYIGGFSTNGTVKNAMFVNCKAYNVYVGSSNPTTFEFINSFVNAFENLSYSTTSSATFVNCVIWQNAYSSACQAATICSSTLINCIIYNSYNVSFNSFPNTTSVTNCIAIGNGNPFSDVFASNNNWYNVPISIFKDSNVLNDLTDAAKAKYLGTDGTPVGMYGGMLPYNTTPSYPQITKMDVASKTTADGKLSVEIEVSAAQ